MEAHIPEVSVSAQQSPEIASEVSKVESEAYYNGYLNNMLRKRVVGILDVEHLHPIVSLIRNNQRPFEYLFDYCGHRYHLLLEHNDLIEDAVENKRLRALGHVVDGGTYQEEDEEIAKCLDLFWPHVAKDCNRRGSKSTEGPSIRDRLVRKPLIKIQVKSSRDGALYKSSHNSFVNYPLSDPVKNPCPEVQVFEKDRIELLDEISTNIFKVKINGVIYCLKVALRDELLREVTILAKVPNHPNLPQLVGLVSAEQGKIDQFVTPFINGKSLGETRTATEKQKKEWKAQISDAVRALHENDLVWGDVNPRNVMIESGTDRAVLIDFAGGVCRGWIDSGLGESKAGDIQGLGRLLSYIDDLKTDDNAVASSRKSVCVYERLASDA